MHEHHVDSGVSLESNFGQMRHAQGARAVAHRWEQFNREWRIGQHDQPNYMCHM